MKKLLFLAVAAFLMWATPASAQVELGLNGGLGQYTGDDFEGAEVGFGAGAHLLFGEDDVRFGFGGAYGQYGFEDTEEKTTAIDVFGLFRYMFPGESARFFLGGQAGFHRLSADIFDVSISSNGFAAGPVAGVHIPLSSLSIELSGDLRYVKLGDISGEGETIEDSDSSGMIWGVKVGIAVPIGG